jgi:plasmid stabilization system protein ParE
VRIRLTKAAVRDLGEIRAYIAADDPAMAHKVVAILDRSIVLIGERPQIGRPTAVPDVREWSVPGLPYVIPYRIAADAIEIVRVYHTSRQRPKEWS